MNRSGKAITQDKIEELQVGITEVLEELNTKPDNKLLTHNGMSGTHTAQGWHNLHLKPPLASVQQLRVTRPKSEKRKGKRGI